MIRNRTRPRAVRLLSDNCVLFEAIERISASRSASLAAESGGSSLIFVGRAPLGFSSSVSSLILAESSSAFPASPTAEGPDRWSAGPADGSSSDETRVCAALNRKVIGYLASVAVGLNHDSLSHHMMD